MAKLILILGLIASLLGFIVVTIVCLLSKGKAVDQVFQADSEEQNLNY